MVPLDDLSAAARLAWSLPGFLRHTLTLDQARDQLVARLRDRADSFLHLARTTIYASPANPYRALLRHIGCEQSDLERLVRQDGLEGALIALYRRGVFLTAEELKGRQSVTRGSLRLEVRPRLLRNPLLRGHLVRNTGGSRGPSMPVAVDLANIRETAVSYALWLDARGGQDWRHALWEVPGGAMLNQLLRQASFGDLPDRLFAQLDPSAPGLHPRYRWSLRLIRWTARLAGRPAAGVPTPQTVPLTDPLPIVSWMSEQLRAGRTPHLRTFVSSAVRLSQAAMASNLDLSGAELTVTGEPATASRLATIERSGAHAVPFCGSSEAGNLGYGCLTPSAPGDLHFLHDLNALIQPGADAVDPLPSDALLLTAVRPSARMTLLNACLGDRAELDSAGCGCATEGLGWGTRLRGLSGFAKLTAGGMTFYDTAVFPLLEELLPARYGGGPTDYQLIEDETPDGRPRLRLLVHPDVGPLDPTAVADTFLTALGRGSGVERVMELQWRSADILTVVREPPRTTAGGKILHMLRSGLSAGTRAGA